MGTSAEPHNSVMGNDKLRNLLTKRDTSADDHNENNILKDLLKQDEVASVDHKARTCSGVPKAEQPNTNNMLLKVVVGFWSLELMFWGVSLQEEVGLIRSREVMYL